MYVDKINGKQRYYNVSMNGLRKKHVNLTKDDVAKKIPNFSIINNSMTREFATTAW